MLDYYSYILLWCVILFIDLVFEGVGSLFILFTQCITLILYQYDEK